MSKAIVGTPIGLNGKKKVWRTSDPLKATCWRCERTLDRSLFTPTAIRNKGECKECRKGSNARYWAKYKADLEAFNLAEMRVK